MCKIFVILANTKVLFYNIPKYNFGNPTEPYGKDRRKIVNSYLYREIPYHLQALCIAKL